MSCWTLWQRLTPRYQLSTKEVYGETNSAPGSPRSQSARNHSSGTPKGRNGSPPTSAKDRYDLKNQGQATMYFAVSSPRDTQPEQEVHVSPRPAFPVRKSSFINSFKQQQRINSARQNFKDPSTSPPKSHTPSLRARTAPHFPVTSLDTHESHSTKHGSGRKLPSASAKPKSPSRRLQSKSARTVRENMLSVNTIVPFDQPKPFIKNPLYSESNNKRYVLRDFDDSTMIIDSDKVLFFKNNKTRQNFFCQNDSTSYLAHLRRVYLNEPKDLAKFAKAPVSGQNNKKLIRERLEYDKRAHTILNYYSREDDIQTATAWANSVDASFRNRQQNENKSPNTRASSSRLPRRVVSPRSPRRSANTRPSSARYHYQQDEQEQSPRQTATDALEDWNVFLKINSRSTLHERQFYLRTPANHPPPPDPQNVNCSCRLCRLEIEMALLRQKHGDHVVFVPQTKNTDVSSHHKTTSPGIGTSNLITANGDSKLEELHHCDTEFVKTGAHIYQSVETMPTNENANGTAEAKQLPEQDGQIRFSEAANGTRQIYSDKELTPTYSETISPSNPDSIKVPKLEIDVEQELKEETLIEKEPQTLDASQKHVQILDYQAESKMFEIIIPNGESTGEKDAGPKIMTDMQVIEEEPPVAELPEQKHEINKNDEDHNIQTAKIMQKNSALSREAVESNEHEELSKTSNKQVDEESKKESLANIDAEHDMESSNLPRLPSTGLTEESHNNKPFQTDVEELDAAGSRDDENNDYNTTHVVEISQC